MAALVAALLIADYGGGARQALRPTSGSLAAGDGHPSRAPARRVNGRVRPEVNSATRKSWVQDAKSWGIHRFVGVAPRAPVMRYAVSFAGLTRQHPAVVEMYTGFNDLFPQKQLAQLVRYGSVPLVQWNPRGAPVKKIAHGKFDRYIRNFALKAKAFGHPMILSFGHEMNGHWSRWSPPYTTPGQFVSAWRRIHGIFARNHVRNVIWSWDPSHTASARRWWPGAAYVDRIGIDGYFRHGQTFKQIFAKALAAIRRYTSKPIYIAETSVQRGTGQVRQIESLFHGVRRYHLAGFVWFDINRLETWRLEGRRPAVRAFRKCTTKNVRCP